MKIHHEASRLPVSTRRRLWRWVVGAAAGSVLLVIAALLTLFGLYTSRRPIPLGLRDITQADREALTERWGEFQPKVLRGLPAAPFTATPRDLDVFFSFMPLYRDRVHFSAEGNTLRADLALPLDRLMPVIGTGRYLNATDTFRVELGPERALRVEVLSAQVNGRPLPVWIKRLLGRKEFHQDFLGLMGGPAFLRNLANLKVRDGALVLTPRQVEEH
ncbi:MAG TPA: hypothetical protein PK640_08245 [Verrucomicrobiota bacterium]|nr:hypothetical protein [Verrucomicrobiota bacterium]